MMILKSKMHPEFSMPHSWHVVHCIPFFAGTLRFFFCSHAGYRSTKRLIGYRFASSIPADPSRQDTLSFVVVQYIFSYSQKKEP